MAQRLVRTIDKDSKEAYKPTTEELDLLSFPSSKRNNAFYKGIPNQNNHNTARLQLAQLMRNRKLEKGYRAIETLANMFNQMNELMKAREKLDKMLFTQAKKMYSNYDDIYGAF